MGNALVTMEADFGRQVKANKRDRLYDENEMIMIIDNFSFFGFGEGMRREIENKARQ